MSTKYKLDFQAKLQQIINLIRENKIHSDDGALVYFKEYLSGILELGGFDNLNWNIHWRTTVNEFGEEVAKSKKHILFIKEIDTILENLERV